MGKKRSVLILLTLFIVIGITLISGPTVYGEQEAKISAQQEETPEEFKLKRVKVEKSDVNFADIKGPILGFPDADINNSGGSRADFILMEKFGSKGDSGLSSITTENWQEKWSKYKNRLIEKAAEEKFDAKSLANCLDKIESESKNVEKKYEVALLPIAAYLAKNGEKDVWVIVCLWEYAGSVSSSREPDKKSFLCLGHIRIWAIEAESLKQIAYSTCE